MTLKAGNGDAIQARHGLESDAMLNDGNNYDLFGIFPRPWQRSQVLSSTRLRPSHFGQVIISGLPSGRDPGNRSNGLDIVAPSSGHSLRLHVGKVEPKYLDSSRLS